MGEAMTSYRLCLVIDKPLNTALRQAAKQHDDTLSRVARRILRDKLLGKIPPGRTP